MHDKGCGRYVAKCIMQSKKSRELVPAIYSIRVKLAIKLTDEVITTDPVQKTAKPKWRIY